VQLADLGAIVADRERVGVAVAVKITNQVENEIGAALIGV